MFRSDLTDLENLKASQAPAIQIISDGTSSGTKMIVHGVEVPFTGIDFYCQNQEDNKYCSMSIRTSEVGQDGLVVERSFHLRHSPQQPSLKDNC